MEDIPLFTLQKLCWTSCNLRGNLLKVNRFDALEGWSEHTGLLLGVKEHPGIIALVCCIKHNIFVNGIILYDNSEHYDLLAIIGLGRNYR